jgi:CAAX amino terminal protease family.
MLSTLVRWRVAPKWYVLALTLPFGIAWMSLAVMRFYFLMSHNVLPSPTRAMVDLVVTLPFGPLWGELAWRAYALRRLQARYSELTASLLLGIYWAVWLIPLLLLPHGPSGTRAQELLAAVITILAWSVIYASLYNRSGQSLSVVILLEAAHVSAMDGVFSTVQAGQLLFIWLAAAFTVFLAAIFGKRMASDSPLHRAELSPGLSANRTSGFLQISLLR